jgi:acetyl-CoA C-acetyltransferase
MSLRGKAYIVGAYEHPTRKADDTSLAQLHAEIADGALLDAGLCKADIDGYFCDSDAPGLGPLSMVDYMGLKVRHLDSTELGGASYLSHVAHAAAAIAAGKCSVALITLAGRPRAESASGTAERHFPASVPDVQYEHPLGPEILNEYAMCAMRHMHEYGTTSEQLAWIKVAASHHAQHNPHAMLRKVVSVADVVESPMIADPLHRLDCCVISDGGDQPRDRAHAEAPAGAAAGPWRGVQEPPWREGRPHLLGRRLVRPHGLCRGARDASRYSVRLDL